MVQVENADYLDGQDVPYLVFEYLDGKDVSGLVKERALGPADTVRLGIDVATGLVFLHANGVYHCDIKPSNLLWTDRGCKIIDFNVAVRSSSSMSRAGGSPRYAPPDASRAAPPSAADLVDRDVYGLGVTLYQVLTGQYPFSQPPDARRDRRRPAAIARVAVSCRTRSSTTLLRAIAPLRGDRYGSAAEFLAALQAIGEVHRRPRPRLSRFPCRSRRRPNVNPFVDHLQSLYSQSPVSNAGTRGKDAYGTYVATALDEHLIPDVLDGRYRLVIITGNAGDGKTAFLERLIRPRASAAGSRVAPRPTGRTCACPTGAGCAPTTTAARTRATGPTTTCSASSSAPSPTAPRPRATRETRLIAINAGRLVDFLTSTRASSPGSTPLVDAGLAGQSAGGDIAVVNLNQRSLVAGGDRQVPVFDRVLGQLTRDGSGRPARAVTWSGPAMPRTTPGRSRIRAPARR